MTSVGATEFTYDLTTSLDYGASGVTFTYDIVNRLHYTAATGINNCINYDITYDIGAAAPQLKPLSSAGSVCFENVTQTAGKMTITGVQFGASATPVTFTVCNTNGTWADCT